jgi:cytochrome c oxidase cbb3-type subunit 3
MNRPATTSTPFALAVVLALASACTGCREEQKHIRGLPPGGALVQGVPQSELQPGPEMPVRRVQNPFEGNAHAISEGKKLYNQYNCSGCHANGGGAIGPALMDDEWIYGSAAEQLFAVIVEGRPQGMPSFGRRIPNDQVWQIVAYVRSMSDLDRGTAAQPQKQQAQMERAAEVKSK